MPCNIGFGRQHATSRPVQPIQSVVEDLFTLPMQTPAALGLVCSTRNGIIDTEGERCMPAKDLYHNSFVHALVKDGWTITHDPLTIAVEGTNLLIDVGAERVVTAEREGKQIAVEIKSFVSLSAVQDLKEAVGQFLLYDLALRQSDADADRVLYLAVRTTVYDTVFQAGVGKLLMRNSALRLVVFDAETEEIRDWIS